MAGTVSYGTTFSFEGNSIGDIKSLAFDGAERSFASRTPLSSQHALKLPGRVDSGTVTLELFYNETAHGAFWDTISAALTGTTPPSASACIVAAPDGTTCTFSGYVKSMAGPKADGEEALMATVVIEITGAITKS